MTVDNTMNVLHAIHDLIMQEIDAGRARMITTKPALLLEKIATKRRISINEVETCIDRIVALGALTRSVDKRGRWTIYFPRPRGQRLPPRDLKPIVHAPPDDPDAVFLEIDTAKLTPWERAVYGLDPYDGFGVVHGYE